MSRTDFVCLIGKNTGELTKAIQAWQVAATHGFWRNIKSLDVQWDHVQEVWAAFIVFDFVLLENTETFELPATTLWEKGRISWER